MTRLFARLAAFAALVPLALPASASDTALPDGREFGASLTLHETTSLAAVAGEPERYTGEPVLLRGKLTDVCTKKGCWTVLAQGGSFLRVRFRDYGFFLPPDALGASALVEGIAEVRTLSEKEARHLAAESKGGDPEAIVGPQREVGFVASGVRLLGSAGEARP